MYLIVPHIKQMLTLQQSKRACKTMLFPLCVPISQEGPEEIATEDG